MDPEKKELVFLSNTAMELVEMNHEDEIYNYVANKVHEITNHSSIIVNSYNKQSKAVRIRSYAGIHQLVTKALKLIGKDLREMSFPFYKNMDVLESGNLSKLDDSLFELSSGALTAALTGQLEKLLQVEGKYTIGLIRGGELFGNILILTRKGQTPFDMHLVETFAKQASISLNRCMAENALKESEQLFRQAFVTIPDPVSISRIDTGEFVRVNQEFLKASGYSEKEVIGKTTDDLNIWQNKEARLRLIEKLKKQGSVKNLKVNLRHKNGEIKQGLLSANIITLNKVPHLLIITHDISEILEARKTQSVIYNINEAANRAETLKQLSQKIQKELSTLMDCENFYIAIYYEKEDKYYFPFHIDQYDTIDGNEFYSLSQSLTDYVRRTGKASLITEHEEKQLIQGNKVGMVGKPTAVWMGAPLIDSKSGTIIGVAAVQSYDNKEAFNKSDLRLLEYVAKQIGTVIGKKEAEELLIESEQRLRDFVNLNTLGIYCFRLDEPISTSLPADEQIKLFFDAICIDCNDSYAEMMGVTREEILGLKIKELMPDDETNLAFFQNLIKNNYRLSTGISHEFNQKGKEKYFSNSIVGTVRKGKLVEAWGTQFDMTERVKVEQALLNEKKRAEESDRLKTAFLANMSHEIRTPMNAILGFSELLSEPDLNQSDRRRYISLITQNGDSLLKLIDDIIDIAKMEAGEIKISKTDCSIKEMFDELIIVFDEIKKKLGKYNIELKIDKNNKDHYVAVYSDPHRIRQVITNLISNALKYTQQGWIEFGCRVTKEGFVEFFVKDTGEGIPKEKQPIIFERFRQIDEGFTRNAGGAGLGLAISKRIVELLGGKIWVESQMDKGSTFYFTIPFEEGEVIDKVVEMNQLGSKFDWNNKKLLIAEDVDSNFELMADILSTTGVEIIRANDGIEVVQLFQKNKDIDLVLMDIRMPRMDGFKATQLIKAIDRDMPVIAVTAYAMVEEYEQSYEAGCDDHITKPLNINMFLKKLNKYLN